MAASLNSLASLLKDQVELVDIGRDSNSDSQGRLEKAKVLYERALNIREKALGSYHPEVATSFKNLASLLLVQVGSTELNRDDDSASQGHLDEAKPLFKRALKIREKVLGPDHPDTATSLDNLASLLQKQVDLSKLSLSREIYRAS